MPSWIGPTVAIALVVIAGSFVVIALATAAAARQAAREMSELTRTLASLRGDLVPTMLAVQSISVRSERLVAALSTEAEELARASKQLRHAVGERLANLDAIYEVLEGEIEDTALDVATTLRTFRTGHGWYARIRRLMGARRRR
jgi:uncharacterized protein YoxC